jgi:TRAP-type C4-dicarboxylate transport system permease small subunit
MVKKALDTIIGVFFIAMVIAVELQVFARYFRISFAWTEEAARYLLVAVSFFGAAVALQEGTHIAITTFLEKFSERVRLYLVSGFVLAMLVFLAAAFWGSILIIQASWSVPTASMPWFKMGHIYLILPISIFLMAAYLLGQMANNIRRLYAGGRQC